jgi:hypothetical protein
MFGGGLAQRFTIHSIIQECHVQHDSVFEKFKDQSLWIRNDPKHDLLTQVEGCFNHIIFLSKKNLGSKPHIRLREITL